MSSDELCASRRQPIWLRIESTTCPKEALRYFALCLQQRDTQSCPQPVLCFFLLALHPGKDLYTYIPYALVYC